MGELAALTLRDISISERKGSVTVRSGKGSKYRVVPLNLDARRAIEQYLAVRPTVADEHLFISQRGEGIKPQAIENVVKKYARRAGLESVSATYAAAHLRQERAGRWRRPGDGGGPDGA